MASKDSVEDLKPLHSANKTNSAKKSSENTGPVSRSTMTSAHSQQVDLEQLTSSVEASPVNRGAWREKERAMRIRSTVISGRKWLGLFKSYSLDGSLAKMSEDLLTSQWASPGHSLTWTVSDINQHIGFCLRLQSEHPIGGTECGLLHTPTATANQMAPSMKSGWWATPRATDGTGGPNKLDEKGRRVSQTNPDLVFGAKLADQVRMWPTPTANEDAAGTPNGKMQKMLANHPGIRGTTPKQWGRGTLNPKWVEWLMGFPIGWTDLKPSETPSSRKSLHKSAKQS